MYSYLWSGSLASATLYRLRREEGKRSSSRRARARADYMTCHVKVGAGHVHETTSAHSAFFDPPIFLCCSSGRSLLLRVSAVVKPCSLRLAKAQNPTLINTTLLNPPPPPPPPPPCLGEFCWHYFRQNRSQKH